MEKYCTNCIFLKPLTDFHKDRMKSDGYAAMCRQCTSQYRRELERKMKTEKKIQEREERMKEIPVEKNLGFFVSFD